MIKEALKYIVDMKESKVQEIYGRVFSDKPLHEVSINQPIARPLQISTLTGLVDYIKTNPDKFASDKESIIQVVSECEVSVLSALNINKERDCYLKSKARTPEIHLDKFIDTERFNIMLQSCFLENVDRDSILRVVGNIKEENVRTVGDDGVSQSVTAKKGIASVGEVVVPNPVTLIPFRTFVEIEQPESKYVFRMKDGPSAALFEADGGEWRLKAMLRIKDYLHEKLIDFPNIKILA